MIGGDLVGTRNVGSKVGEFRGSGDLKQLQIWGKGNCGKEKSEDG